MGHTRRKARSVNAHAWRQISLTVLIPALVFVGGAGSPVAADGPGPSGHDVGQATFATPDRLVYEVSVDADGFADDQLWGVDADGGDRILLADPSASGHQLRQWLVTPDGAWVVFGVADGTSCPLTRQGCVSRLWRVPITGPASAATPVTPNGYWEWVLGSPRSNGVVDGRLVLLADDAVPVGSLAPARLVSVPVTGGVPTVLSSTPVRSNTVVLPPDGNRVVFAQSTSAVATDAALHSVAVTGGEAALLSPSLPAGPFGYALPTVHITNDGATVILLHRASGQRRVTARAITGVGPARALTPLLADGLALDVVHDRSWGITEPVLFRFDGHAWSNTSSGTAASLVDLGEVPNDAWVTTQGTHAIWTDWDKVVAIPLAGPSAAALTLAGPGEHVHSLDLLDPEVIIGVHQGTDLVLRSHVPANGSAGVEAGRWNDGTCAPPVGGPCTPRSILPVLPGGALVVAHGEGPAAGVWVINTTINGLSPQRLFAFAPEGGTISYALVAPSDPLPRRFAFTVVQPGGENQLVVGALPFEGPVDWRQTTVVSHPTSFVDVGPTHPFLDAIRWMAARQITTGYADGTFRPSDDVVRMAMAAFLYRFDGPTPAPGPALGADPAVVPAAVVPAAPFSDVPIDHPFYAEITWLASSGITTGFPDGTFRPAEPLPRMAMAAFLYRLAGEPAFTPPTVSPFSDVPVDHPFYTEIAWLASTGVSEGYQDGTYRPTASISRQAMSAFLHRMDELAEG